MTDRLTIDVQIERCAIRHDVPDDVDSVMLAALRAAVADEWRSAVAREGYQPVQDPPHTEIVWRTIPEYVVDPKTGQEIKLPDRWVCAIGDVVRTADLPVPLPPGYTAPPGISRICFPR